MSFVAKVFVVFNLLLAALFFYFAMYEWSAQVKWQRMYQEEKALKVTDVAELQTQMRGLYADKVKAEKAADFAKIEMSREKLERDKERDAALALKAELAKKQNELELANASKEEIDRDYRRVSAELNKARAVVLKIEQAMNVEKDNATRAANARAEMEIQYNQLSSQVAATNRQTRQLEQDLSIANHRLEEYIRVYGASTAGDSLPQPNLTAQVLAVRNDVGLVMISVGSKQEVKVGYQFTITRGPKYIGKVQIETVYPEMASAKIIPDLMAKGEQVEVHDMAVSGRP